MEFLDFEKPLEELHQQLQKLKEVAQKGKVDVGDAIRELEAKIAATQQQLYRNLSGWQRVQLSRHPQRPYTLYYIQKICTRFVELHGDRCGNDDHAMVGGLGDVDGRTIVFVGQQKGTTTKERQYRNFGMANPSGYRKALRLFRLAERFDFPIVTLIDTPGAFPGLEAEEQGQAEAIARNLFEMVRLKVPVVCIIIGEGASGGALGIGIGDRVLMLENTWYSVISPESCSSILWHSWEKKEEAAEQLKLTAGHMKALGFIDGIIEEPLGGAHNDPEAMAEKIKSVILEQIDELSALSPPERIAARIKKFSSMGFYQEA